MAESGPVSVGSILRRKEHGAVEDWTPGLLLSTSSIKVLLADSELGYPMVHPQQPTRLDSLLLASPLEEIPPPAPPETSACTPIPSSLYMGLEVCHVPVSPSQADLGSPHVMTLPGVPSLRYTHHHHHYCLVTSGPDPRPPSRLLILLLSEQGRPLQAGRMEALPIRLALAAFCHPVPSGLIFHCSLLWPPHCLPSRAVGSPARLPFGPFFPPDIPSLINCTSHSTWPVATN